MRTRLVQLSAVVGLVAMVLAAGCRKQTSPDQSPTRLAACEGRDGREAVDDCYAAQAVRDPGFCDQIVGPAVKNACFQKAALGDRPALCGKIDSARQRARCVMDIAVSKRDPAGCDPIPDPSTRFDCFATLALHDPLVCDRLKDPSLRDDCYTQALTDSGAKLQGEPPCGRIADPLKQKYCWSMAALHDPPLCEKIPTTEEDRDVCFKTAMLGSTSPVDCAKIQTPSRADLCFDAVARKSRDEGSCARIAGAELQEGCIVAVAIELRSPAPCAKIADATRQKACREGATTTPASSVWPASLELLRHGGVTRTGPNAYTLTRPALQAVLNPTNAAGVRVVPVAEDGAFTGDRIFGISKDSWMTALGFENGDTVQRINGRDLNSPETALALWSDLHKADRIEVELTRRGAPQKLVYTIP